MTQTTVAPMSALAALLDREAIRDRITRLARGEDRRDAGLISSAFWADATTDYGVFQGSFADYLAWVVPGSDAITDTQHVVGQSFIELAGDTAKVETQVVSYHRVDMGADEQVGGERDICIGGRYLDVFARRSGEWRIAARTMLYDWYQDWGAATDWSRGVMGLPFTDPRYPGRSTGDWSEVFFAAS